MSPRTRAAIEASGLQLVDIPGVAERLSISVRGVRRLIENGELLSVRAGGRRLIPDYAIDEYIRSRVAAAEEAQTA